MDLGPPYSSMTPDSYSLRTSKSDLDIGLLEVQGLEMGSWRSRVDLNPMTRLLIRRETQTHRKEAT